MLIRTVVELVPSIVTFTDLVPSTSESSHRKCRNGLVFQFFPTQFAKTSLRPRLEEGELSVGEFHLGTNLVLRLFMKVEAGQNLPVPAAHLVQDVQHDECIFAADGLFLGIPIGVDDYATCLQIGHIPARLDGDIYIGSHLTANDGPDKTHQALGIAQFAALNSLDHNQVTIVNLVIQFLGPQLTAKIEPDATGE